MTEMNGVQAVGIQGVPDPLPEGLAVLDVRQTDEWVAGHIEGAVHIPLHELMARYDEVPDAQLLVVCTVGARSGHAAAYLRHQGRDAVNLAGGLLDWVAAGRPMVSETGVPPVVL
jgi:rhodanese-related sulfurtransferase